MNEITELTTQTIKALAKTARHHGAKFRFKGYEFYLDHYGREYRLQRWEAGLYDGQSHAIEVLNAPNLKVLTAAMQCKDRDGKLAPLVDVSLNQTDAFEHERITQAHDLRGRKAILALAYFPGMSIEERVVECTGGFGCSPNSRGRAVFATAAFDGEDYRFERYQFDAVVSES